MTTQDILFVVKNDIRNFFDSPDLELSRNNFPAIQHDLNEICDDYNKKTEFVDHAPKITGVDLDENFSYLNLTFHIVDCEFVKLRVDLKR